MLSRDQCRANSKGLLAWGRGGEEDGWHETEEGGAEFDKQRWGEEDDGFEG